MKKILLAIPTKDRSEMVQEVLNYELRYYKNYEICLCYYDSSQDYKTKQVIAKAGERNKINIIYKKMDSKLCLDYKIIEMFKDFSKSEYDYFWLINDSISISEQMLKKVIEAAEEGYDLIRLPLSGDGRKDDYITDNVNKWFVECSQGMAHMASTVMNKSLLQVGANWDDLREKYVHNNELDDKHGYFFTVGFYLEQILKLRQFRGLFIGNCCKWRRDSPLKKNNIYWYKHVFDTWAKSYPETILKLPNIYTDKEEVIRKSDNLGPGRFSKEMLIHYRLNGMYDVYTYEKYKKYFRYITNEPEAVCYQIATEPVESLRKVYSNLISVEDSWEQKLSNIEQKLDKDQKIYIYGAGLYGEKAVSKLIKDGFKVRNVLVTNEDDNLTELEGIKIVSADGVKFCDEEQIIICTLPGTAAKIKEELDKRKIHNYIGLFDV